MRRPPRNEAEAPIWREEVQGIFNAERQHGAAWDDVYASSVTVGGGASSPAFTAYNGNLRAYEFVGTGPTTKDMNLGFQLYHSREDNSPIVPHLHLYIPSDGSGGVIEFGCEYTWTDIGQLGVVSTTTVYGTFTAAASTVYNNAILSFGEIAGTGMGMSSIFMCRIFRNPADETDTFGSSVWLKSADIHIKKTWLGSYQSTSRR